MELGKILTFVGEGLEIGITPEAEEIFQNWYENLERSIHSKRLEGHTLRFMGLLAINDLKNEYSSSYPPQIIILGDFNDEPFDKSLAGHLLATRDRTLVKQNDLYFYNPFWRHLGETLPHSYGLHSGSICGTCFHRTGEETKWRTFDQIIVSSSFLRDDRWYIEEEYTQILHYPPFDDLLLNKSTIFDHRPVLSYIQRSFNDFNKEATHD